MGAIPIPLDSDKPWQVWPISCTYSAIIAYILSLSLAWTYSFVTKMRKKQV